MLSAMNLQDCYQASNDVSARNYSRRRRCKGFTLAEILIALGILVIGMSMVAAIFPAAMEFNRASTNSTLGTIICENGLVLSEMTLTAEIVGDSVVLQAYVDDAHLPDAEHLYYLTKAQQHYPTDTEDSRTGFVMMARKVSATGSTYQLVTVAYRKTEKSNTVALVPITCSISGRDITLSGANNTSLRIGTPVINRATGQYAFVDSINSTGTAGTLDIDPAKRSMPDGSSYVLLERTSTGGAINIGDMRRSPAIGAMSKVSGLRHDPAPEPDPNPNP